MLVFKLYDLFFTSSVQVSEKMSIFSKQKTNIKRVYSSLKSDISVDKTDKKMDPVNFENIEKDILYFVKRIEKLQKLIININSDNNKKYL